MSYSDNATKTITGYDPEKALEYLMLADLMDPMDITSTIKPFLEYLSIDTPLYIVEQSRVVAHKKFVNELQDKTISYLE